MITFKRLYECDFKENTKATHPDRPAPEAPISIVIGKLEIAIFWEDVIVTTEVIFCKVKTKSVIIPVD